LLDPAVRPVRLFRMYSRWYFVFASPVSGIFLTPFWFPFPLIVQAQYNPVVSQFLTFYLPVLNMFPHPDTSGACRIAHV